MCALQPTKNAKKVTIVITKIKWEEVTQFFPNSLSSCALNSSSDIMVFNFRCKNKGSSKNTKLRFPHFKKNVEGYLYFRFMIGRYFNWRTLVLLVAISIVGGTVLYSRYLAQKIEGEEKQRVQEWVDASKVLMKSNESESIAFSNFIIANNTDIPLIWTTDNDSIIEARNIDSAKILADKNYLYRKLAEFKKIHPPLKWEVNNKPLEYNRVYYGNTLLLNEVQYYPIIQLFIVALFIFVVLALLATQNRSTQNQVWAGMAKETAHQMGTPLSSLQGWVEMLRENPDNESMVAEIEKDVNRLKLVSDRFGKIGSKPQLIETNLTHQIENMQQYMRRRASGKVQINFNKTTHDMIALISPPLFDWVLENLLKNGLDAMEGKGILTIDLTENEKCIFVDVTDTGKGIAAGNIKNVFKPGFTTKKRGWGLGLTLSKRIMEQYHKGALFVKHSEVGKGTTFRVTINK